MTIESYKKWKQGKPIHKAKAVIDFYKTNPTIEQEKIRSKQITQVGIVSLVCGITLGFGIVLILAI